MSKSIETGHEKNVSNLGVLNTAIDTMGTTYKPSNPSIAKDALVLKKTNADKTMKDVTTSKVAYSNAVNSRDDAYHGMGELATRVFSSFESCGATQNSIDTLKGLKAKVDGKRIGKKKTPVSKPTTSSTSAPEDEKSISVSQMGFDNRKANFEIFMAFVAAEPKYKPNEDDLKITAIDEYIAKLDPLNTNVNKTLKVLQHAKELRDHELYAPDTGILDLSRSVKKYVISAVGFKSDTKKKISQITFTDKKL